MDSPLKTPTSGFSESNPSGLSTTPPPSPFMKHGRNSSDLHLHTELSPQRAGRERGIFIPRLQAEGGIQGKVSPTQIRSADQAQAHEDGQNFVPIASPTMRPSSRASPVSISLGDNEAPSFAEEELAVRSAELTIDAMQYVRSGQQRTIWVSRIPTAFGSPLDAVGIGISFRLAKDGSFLVTDVAPNSGADVSGVMVNDVIVAVGDVPASSLSTSQLVHRIKGPSSTMIKLTLEAMLRQGESKIGDHTSESQRSSPHTSSIVQTSTIEHTSARKSLSPQEMNGSKTKSSKPYSTQPFPCFDRAEMRVTGLESDQVRSRRSVKKADGTRDTTEALTLSSRPNPMSRPLLPYTVLPSSSLTDTAQEWDSDKERHVSGGGTSAMVDVYLHDTRFPQPEPFEQARSQLKVEQRILRIGSNDTEFSGLSGISTSMAMSAFGFDRTVSISSGDHDRAVSESSGSFTLDRAEGESLSFIMDLLDFEPWAERMHATMSITESNMEKICAVFVENQRRMREWKGACNELQRLAHRLLDEKQVMKAQNLTLQDELAATRNRSIFLQRLFHEQSFGGDEKAQREHAEKKAGERHVDEGTL